jgi:hypothetical protein
MLKTPTHIRPDLYNNFIMEIQDKTKDELITELNELLKTNYLKVQNETLTAELLVKMKNCFPKKRARLSVNHSQQGLLQNEKKIVLMN